MEYLRCVGISEQHYTAHALGTVTIVVIAVGITDSQEEIMTVDKFPGL
jgi:hypothetical protein